MRKPKRIPQAQGSSTMKRFLRLGGFSLLFTFILLCSSLLHAREVTDMAGRKVTVPDRIAKVFGSTPPATNIVYSIDPSLLVGLNATPNNAEMAYLRKDTLELPVIGGWYADKTANAESILKAAPDVVIGWLWRNSALNEKVEAVLGHLNLPIFYINVDSLYDYPAAFLALGKLLQREERGRMLSEYVVQSLESIRPILDSIPELKKPTVYYAEDPDGLRSECHVSEHAALIPISGGSNVHHCENRAGYGMEKVTLEQVMLYNPEVILVRDERFFWSVFHDPRWQSIRAVKDKRVYFIPQMPYNWFDRPPSFMRIMGVKWLTNLLHPDIYSIDIVKETQEFYRLFLGLDLSEKEIKGIMYP